MSWRLRVAQARPPRRRRRAAPEKPPFVAVLGSCDLRCAWCNYTGAAVLSGDEELGRVGAELARLRAAGHRRVGLGLHHSEPTQHPRLPAIIARARALGFDEVELSTSGLRLADRDYLRELRHQGLTSVILTFVGVEPTVSDLLLGRSGATAAKLAALDHCLAEGLAPHVVVLLLRPALAGLPAALTELATGLGDADALLHGLVPDTVPGTPAARVAALWPRFEELAWLLSRPGLPPDFMVQSSEMPPCVRRASPRLAGDQAPRAETGLAFVKAGDACARCGDAASCHGVEATYLAASGAVPGVVVAPREPPPPDLEALRGLLGAPLSEAAVPAGEAGEAWQRRVVARLAPLRRGLAPPEAGPEAGPAAGPAAAPDLAPAAAGFEVVRLTLAAERVEVHLRAGRAVMELYVEPRGAARRCFRAGPTYAVSYRSSTPPDTDARRRLVDALLARLEGTT